MTEADQPVLADLQSDDVELDPNATAYPIGDTRLQRGAIVHQTYWKAYGNWQPSAWQLPFLVTLDGRPIGAQELEANDFSRLGVVDSSSFLATQHRGRGHGKRMRQAVLTLAFGPLGARAAITSAWHDNHASLGVSQALGYQPNGKALHPRGDSVDTMVHMLLSREDWLASRQSSGITVSGFEPCRPLFAHEAAEILESAAKY